MSVFAFSAECVEDVCGFLMGISFRHRIKNFQFSQGEVFPDLDGKIEVDCALSELIELALQLDDGHVIVESLRLNSGKVVKVLFA
ncbi:TPA: hypothetical protein ACNV18_005812 [Pseudomonas putida]